jgi:hypothetical protein
LTLARFARVCAEAEEMLKTRQRRMKAKLKISRGLWRRPKRKSDEREGRPLGVGEHRNVFLVINPFLGNRLTQKYRQGMRQGLRKSIITVRGRGKKLNLLG